MKQHDMFGHDAESQTERPSLPVVMALPWETPPPTPHNFLSLGAGVQSSALALMAAKGEIEPRLDAAIFADTQAEPASVYQWLDWLEAEISRSPHPYPVHRVSKGDLRAHALTLRTTPEGMLYSPTCIPVFCKDADGKKGMIQTRACTRDFKLAQIKKKSRELAHVRRGAIDVVVTQWVGISLDEIQRVKDSRDPWVQLRYPLIERGMNREACLAWMQRNNYPRPPRSACVFCPYHSNAEWARLKSDEPEAFASAVEFEREIQAVKAASENFDTTPFLHASLQPLDSVDFATREERAGQQLIADWNDECEGMCGL